MGELDQGLDDGLVGRVRLGALLVAEAPYEGAVQLEHGHRQPAQVGQVRVPGAEVVDGDPHAHVAEGLEGLERPPRGAHDRGFGELQLEQLRCEPGLGEDPGDIADQVGVPDLPDRDVDGDEDRGVAGPLDLPAPRLPACGPQHPAPQLDDGAVLFRDPDEPIRRQTPELRVAPPDQGLHPAHRAALQIHQRLVLQLELAALDGRPEGGAEGLAGHPVGVALRVEEGPAGLAVGLRPVQRRVRGLHQPGRRGPVRGPLHHADRRGDRQPLPGQVERLLDRGQDAAGQVRELFGAGGVLDQQRELVAAEPGHQVAAGAAVAGLVGALGQPGGHRGQQPVADAVAEGVVDRLEAVQVQVAQADPAGAAVLVRGRLQGGGEPLEEQRPVGQPGHRVVHLEVPQPGLEVAAVADVGDGQQHVPGPGDGAEGDLGPQRVPVGVFEPAGAAQSGLPAAQHLLVGLPGPGLGAEVDEVGGALLDEGVRLGAQEGGQGGVGGDDAAAAVDDGHGEVGSVEGGPVVAQFGLGVGRRGRHDRHCLVTLRNGRSDAVGRRTGFIRGSAHRWLPQCSCVSVQESVPIIEAAGRPYPAASPCGGRHFGVLTACRRPPARSFRRGFEHACTLADLA